MADITKSIGIDRRAFANKNFVQAFCRIVSLRNNTFFIEEPRVQESKC